MKELVQVRVQYATRQQCCKTHKRPLPFTSTTIFLLHCNECGAVIFEPCAVICKHSNDAVVSHKAIETNGNDGMTASACGVILAVRTVWCKQ
jgi:hypothetical protein